MVGKSAVRPRTTRVNCIVDRDRTASLPLSGMPMEDRWCADGHNAGGPLVATASGPTRLPLADRYRSAIFLLAGICPKTSGIRVVMFKSAKPYAWSKLH